MLECESRGPVATNQWQVVDPTAGLVTSQPLICWDWTFIVGGNIGCHPDRLELLCREHLSGTLAVWLSGNLPLCLSASASLLPTCSPALDLATILSPRLSRLLSYTTPAESIPPIQTRCRSIYSHGSPIKNRKPFRQGCIISLSLAVEDAQVESLQGRISAAVALPSPPYGAKAGHYTQRPPSKTKCPHCSTNNRRRPRRQTMALAATDFQP